MGKKNGELTVAWQYKSYGFFAGIVAFILCIVLPPFSPLRESLQQIYPHLPPLALDVVANNVMDVLAILVLMVIWWITEAVPLPATALLPTILAPLLQVKVVADEGIQGMAMGQILSNYADPIIFLFLGSFLLAAMLQGEGVDKKIAFWILQQPLVARSMSALLFALMGVTAFLSMWLSNTAVSAMMLPVALAIIQSDAQEDRKSQSAFALLLGVAWASSIGGIATVVGTPPNGIAVAMLARHNIAHFDFLQWFFYGFPISCCLLVAGWWILKRMFPKKEISVDLSVLAGQQGGVSFPQKIAIGIFLLTVLGWTVPPLLKNVALEPVRSIAASLSLWVVAMLGGILALVFPVQLRPFRSLLPWKSAAQRVDWGTLLLFGGGLALSDLLVSSGVGHILAHLFLSLFGKLSTPLLMLSVVLFMNFFTEISSNTAVTAFVVPLLITFSIGSGADPVFLVLAAAFGASLAFMMPVATPPNALVFGTGKIPLPKMIATGFRMNLLSWIVVSGVLILWYIFGR